MLFANVLEIDLKFSSKLTLKISMSMSYLLENINPALHITIDTSKSSLFIQLTIDTLDISKNKHQ